VAVGATLITRRLEVARSRPTIGVESLSVFFVPVRRRQLELLELRSRHDDDWSSDTEAPDDELTAGEWSMSCHRAADVAAWLRDAGAQLAVPRTKATP
jgi:hypothetical protein